MPHLQKKVQQCITIKTTEMVGDEHTSKAKTTSVVDTDYKNVL